MNLVFAFDFEPTEHQISQLPDVSKLIALKTAFNEIGELSVRTENGEYTANAHFKVFDCLEPIDGLHQYAHFAFEWIIDDEPIHTDQFIVDMNEITYVVDFKVGMAVITLDNVVHMNNTKSHVFR